MGLIASSESSYKEEADDFVTAAGNGDADRLFKGFYALAPLMVSRAELLTQSGMYLNAKRSTDGATALAAAIFGGHLDMALELVKDYEGVDVNKLWISHRKIVKKIEKDVPMPQKTHIVRNASLLLERRITP
eukprot:scaffold2677_cov220-Pinguiococcus_pyrenoidosus.AAC.1